VDISTSDFYSTAGRLFIKGHQGHSDVTRFSHADLVI